MQKSEKIVIDIGEKKEQDFYEAWGIRVAEKYTFYYDESNNCRKFWLDDERMHFNSNYTEDFVLVGVVTKDEKVQISLEELRQLLGLQNNVKEIKFKKHFAEKDFLSCTKKPRLGKLLTWIDNSPLYIHYIQVNNLYYALVEIIDSIMNPIEMEDYGYNYYEVKSRFYTMFKGKEEELQLLMFKYKFPNVGKTEVKSFCNELLQLLGSRKDMNTEEKFITGMLVRAGERGELVFLHDNDDFIMQKNYLEFYLSPIRTFYNSQHIFDEETEIQEKLEKYSLQRNGKEVDSFKFVNSTEEVLVQISDVIAGILGKLFKYINSTTINEMRKDIAILTQTQVNCILLLGKIRVESEIENKGFLHSIAPLAEIEKLNTFLNLVLARKREL